MKSILKAWLITASIAAAINLVWFFINTTKNGNPWSEIIGVIPILITSFVTILVGSLVYWLLSSKLKRGELIFQIGAVVITVLSVMGSPKLHDGSIVPAEFRMMDIPMHFVAGLLCAFLVPVLAKRQ
jgi:ABC-type tungstate transport system substrate-binding protein